MAHYWNRTPSFDHEATRPSKRKSWTTIERYACRCGAWGEKGGGSQVVTAVLWNQRRVTAPKLLWQDGKCLPLDGKCADCGGEAGAVCSCGAPVCNVCRGEYHTRLPKLGCANWAGRKLLEEVLTKAEKA